MWSIRLVVNVTVVTMFAMDSRFVDLDAGTNALSLYLQALYIVYRREEKSGNGM